MQTANEGRRAPAPPRDGAIREAAYEPPQVVADDARYSMETRLIRTLRGDAPPQHVTFLGGRAFVTSGDDAVLRVHELDGRLLRSAPVPAGSYNVDEGFGLVFTPSLEQGTLCTFSARGAAIEQTHVARSSHDACFVMIA